jgi:hypothetical protein
MMANHSTLMSVKISFKNKVICFDPKNNGEVVLYKLVNIFICNLNKPNKNDFCRLINI